MSRPALLLLLVLLQGCEPAPSPSAKISASEALSGAASAGFSRALAPRRFVFPADHGSHPEYRNEWWYVTGNLDTGQGRRFGYQATFFRIGLRPPGVASRRSGWATDQVWMAHMALSDIQGGEHIPEERLVRSALGLAGFDRLPFRVWVEDWQLSSAAAGNFPWRLAMSGERFDLDLNLSSERQPVLQGQQGLSQKSAEPGNASYYYSIPRLVTGGRISLDGVDYGVTGLSWLDREWSTSALGPDQTGWDWFSLQMFDGTDLMYYRLRNRDAITDPHSAGSLVEPSGEIRRFTAGDIELEPSAWWESPAGSRYPIVWELRLAPLDRNLQVRAALPEQEMDLSVRYWEGAVDVLEAGVPVGRGYMELTGY